MLATLAMPQWLEPLDARQNHAIPLTMAHATKPYTAYGITKSLGREGDEAGDETAEARL